MYVAASLPANVGACTDIALLKALREYERVYAQLCTRSAPENVRNELADAVQAIRDELQRRGRIVPVLVRTGYGGMGAAA